MLIKQFVEEMTLKGGWPKNPVLYIRFLKAIPGERRNISILSVESGTSSQYGCKIVRNLEKAGYVKRVFGGQARYVILTEEGENVVRGFRE